MIVKKSSRVKSTGRNVTPLRAAPPFSNFQTQGSKRSRSARRGRQLSELGNGCNKDSFRAMSACVRRERGGALPSGRRRGRGEVHALRNSGTSVTCREDSCTPVCSAQGPSSARVSEDSSHDSSSAFCSSGLTLPSGVSSFLLDCLDVDSPTSDEDSTLSSIEEFRKADNYDDGWRAGDALMKNSTLLDLSHAQDLALQPEPNLSSIIELSLEPDEDEEEKFFSRSPVRVPSETLASDMASGAELRSVQERTPENTRPVAPYPAVRKCYAEKRKPLKCRKVTFSDIVSVRNVSSLKCVQTEQRENQENRDHPDTSGSSETTVRFFDFADALEREAFFLRLKHTHSFTFPAKPILSGT